MAESEGFEPPIDLRLCLISSQVHSTGLCQLSALFYFISGLRVTASSLDRQRRFRPLLGLSIYPCRRLRKSLGNGVKLRGDRSMDSRACILAASAGPACRLRFRRSSGGRCRRIRRRRPGRCRAVCRLGRGRQSRGDGLSKTPRRTGRSPAKCGAGGDAMGAVRHRLCAELQHIWPTLDRQCAPGHWMDRPIRMERQRCENRDQRGRGTGRTRPHGLS